MPALIRPSNERGHAKIDWLESFHTFSFAEYQDPKHVHFRKLRVINEDWVQPGEGFDTHSHKDMEIITYVLEGALQHKDSMGNASVIRPGEVQRMSAGTGVTHSEFNASEKELVHLLQIWIFPDQPNLKPGYEQKAFDEKGRKNKLRLIASPEGKEGSVTLHQDALLYDAALEKGRALEFKTRPGRGVWVQIIEGKLKFSGLELKTGDGFSAEEEASLHFAADEPSRFLLFDLA